MLGELQTRRSCDSLRRPDVDHEKDYDLNLLCIARFAGAKRMTNMFLDIN